VAAFPPRAPTFAASQLRLPSQLHRSEDRRAEFVGVPWNFGWHRRLLTWRLTGEPAMATVLLVEGEDQVRVLAESYLEEQGHEVLSAGTPDGALALLEKFAACGHPVHQCGSQRRARGRHRSRPGSVQAKVKPQSALYDRAQCDRRDESAFCQELGFSGEALHSGTIAGDACRSFPGQPAGAPPGG